MSEYASCWQACLHVLPSSAPSLQYTQACCAQALCIFTGRACQACSKLDVQAICQYVADTLKQAESYDLLVLRSIVEDMTVSSRLSWEPSLTCATFAAIECAFMSIHSAVGGTGCFLLPCARYTSKSFWQRSDMPIFSVRVAVSCGAFCPDPISIQGFTLLRPCAGHLPCQRCEWRAGGGSGGWSSPAAPDPEPGSQ